jgi:predicted MFS family arabinose efflux permease
MAYNMQWQPWFEQAFQSRQLLGWLWVGMALAVLLGNKLVVWLREKSGGVEKALLVSQLAIALFGAITVWVPVFGLSLLSFLLHEVPRGTFRPLSDAYLHKHIPSGQRATLGSFQSMAHHAGGAVGLAVSGLVAQRFGIPAAWYVSSLTLVVGSWLVYKKYSQPA